MRIDEQLLIHIGYPKCASTWLQKEIFTSGKNEYFEPLSTANDGKSSFFKQFIISKKGYLLNSAVYNEAEIMPELLNIVNIKRSHLNKTFVLSSERLAGNPYTGGFDAKNIADRLQHFFPKAKILIVIREQKSAMVSNYFQYLDIWGVLGYKDYFNHQYDFVPMFSPHYFNYLHLIKHYYSLFGKENVLVLPYELLVKNSKSFLYEIGKLINKDLQIDASIFAKRKNEKLNHFSLYHLRKLNYLTNSNSLNFYSKLHLKSFSEPIMNLQKKIDQWIPNAWNQSTKQKVTEFVEEKFGDSFSDSNKKLSQLIDLDLSEYNYHN